MTKRPLTLLLGTVTCLAGLFLQLSADPKPPEPQFRAGAHIQDITPPFDSLLINGGFTERRRGRMNPGDLKARCFILEKARTTIALAVVDSCMIPRDVCDQAKSLVFQATGIPPEKIVIAATHTHSAPSTMDYCLGTMADEAYTRFLPGKIAEGLIQAHQKLEPARIGWNQVKATGYTHCRRWITRPDKMLTDPFGEKTVRAMMHPGFRNPNYIGPSGPVDDELSILSMQALDGKPLGVIANFSMHYHGGGGGPADYFGLFSDRLAKQLATGGREPVCAMTQGTSGDLYLSDYSGPPKNSEISSYTDGLVKLAKEAAAKIKHQDNPPLGMDQRTLTLDRRLPDAKRLAWADRLLQHMQGRRPKTRPEVYAEQTRYLHANPTEELVLQSLRIGDLGITMTPNEVYAITGLKLKARSPFASTFNIELANGAAGYIPPPEQHALGGYTTWPARTAGLEMKAEPKIVETLLASLESLAGRPRRPMAPRRDRYATAILADQPLAYWQCEEFEGNLLKDASGNKRVGRIEGNVAYHLPGPGSPSFSENHALQLVGGSVTAEIAEARSLSFWFWNGMTTDVRDNTGDLLQFGTTRLRIGGKADEKPSLILENGDLKIVGNTPLQERTWHHVVLTRDKTRIVLSLDGVRQATIDLPLADTDFFKFRFGGSQPLEGRIDEIAFYDRVLLPGEIEAHFKTVSLEKITKAEPESQPRSPSDSLKAIHVPEGFRVELVASEPLVQDPVAIDWAPDGRLWVAEMADYPSGIDGKPGGRVRFLEDRDGDGRYESSTLFLDGLNFPAGVMSWQNGVLIAAAPDILYAEDTTGDGRADKREILFSGFKEGNQQLRVNGLHWGLDNWVHGANGSHFAGYAQGTTITSPRSGKATRLDSFDFRLKPESGLVEPLSGPSQFGRARDDWGNSFGVQNSFPLWHYLIEQRYLNGNPDYPSPDPRRQLRPQNARVFPASRPQKRFHSFHNSGRFTSACSPMILRDDLLFRDRATHAFTCEPFHNLVQHVILKRDGYSFSAERPGSETTTDFFASEDRWCRPVMARTGPDGALWIVDMYRYMIEHPDWLPKDGKEEMKSHERQGEEFGRIYRILPKAKPPRPFPPLARSSPEDLVDFLGNSNGVIRDLAHRLLVEGKAVSVTDHLVAQVTHHLIPQARLHALGVLDGIDRLEDQVIGMALHDAHPWLRRHALLLATPRLDHSESLLDQAILLLRDSDPAVRLQAACALGASRKAKASEALIRFGSEHADDPLVRALVFHSALAQTDGFASKIITHQTLLDDLIRTPKKHSPSVRNRVVDYFKNLDPKTHPETWTRTLASWLDRSPGDVGQFARLLTAARDLLLNEETPEIIRAGAASLLGREKERQQEDQTVLLSLLGPKSSAIVGKASLASLARFAGDELPALILPSWPTRSPAIRKDLIDTLLQRKGWTLATLSAMEEGRIPHNDFDPTRRQRLLTHRDLDIRQLSGRVFGRSATTGRKQHLDSFRPALMLEGNETKGKALFTQRCATCHLPPDGQPPNGPDLRAITDRSKEGLFIAILDPNQSVDPNYLGYTVTLGNGSSLYGRILSETTHHLTLRLLDGSDHQLARRNIRSLTASDLSLMPEGLETGLSHQELADLIRYLQIFGTQDEKR
jgi:putative membrane-bound dehydrogenase-like protein